MKKIQTNNLYKQKGSFQGPLEVYYKDNLYIKDSFLGLRCVLYGEGLLVRNRSDLLYLRTS